MGERKDENYKKVTVALNITIAKNLKALIMAHNLSERKLCNLIEHDKVSITRGYLVQLLNNPSKHSIPATFLLACCDFFNINIEDLISDEFNASEYVNNPYIRHKEYLNIDKKLQEYELYRNEQETKDSTLKKENTSIYAEGENFIMAPNHLLFNGYLQDYFCYYYPTSSSENKNDNGTIINGILSLKAAGQYCKATLKIDTNTVDDNGNVNYKEYTGYAVISTPVHSLNCIMYSKLIGEYCFIMFRHFKINFGKQDCRIAEVLSSSSAAEDRRPTVLRMLLSREKLSDEDLKIIAPSLNLNYSTIITNESSLIKLSQKCVEYQKILDELIKEKKPENMFVYKENDIYNIAMKHLKDKVKTLEFIMQLRDVSLSYRYNKVGSKTDNIVRDILLSRGYYKKTLNNKKSNT